MLRWCILLPNSHVLPGDIFQFWHENVCGSCHQRVGATEKKKRHSWTLSRLLWNNNVTTLIVPTSPISSFSSVDLPAPLGPTRATRVSKSIPNSKFLYMCGYRKERPRLKTTSHFKWMELQKLSNILCTHCVITVLEAHILNHDNRRRNLPTGRKIKWQSLWEAEAGISTMKITAIFFKVYVC